MKYGIFSCNDWIYPDSTGGGLSADLCSVKGSYANFQLILEDTKKSVNWSVLYDGDFQGNSELYRLLPVTVNRNSDFFEPLDTKPRTGADLEKHFTRNAPFEVYDPMLPITESSFESDGRVALYVSFKIPAEMKAGVYSGRLVLDDGNSSVSVPFKIKVYDILMPSKTSLNIANWCNFSCKAYGCTLRDEKYFETIYKIARFGLRAHQNCIYLYLTLFDCSYEDGRYIYDFKEVKKYIETMLSMGFSRIEAMHIVGIYQRFIKPVVGGSVYDDNGREALGEFLEQWYAFICENGWKDIVIQHIGDEPKDGDVERYRQLCLFVKRYMPDIPLVEAVLSPDVCDVVDIPVPITRHYQLHKERYDRYFTDKKEVWMYTCCWPVAPYLNRFLDMPLLSVRLLHWLNYKLGFTGYLHWGFCSQGDGQDVYTAPSIAFKYMGVPQSDQYLPAGDTNIVYPTKNGPIGSVRLEMMRAGIEDYEILKMLEKNDGGAVKAFVDAVVDGDWCAAVEYGEFEVLLKKMLEKL